MINAPEQSVCRAYWQSGSSIASCRASMASTSPLRELRSGTCRSMMAVISSDRCTPMAETLRQSEVISARKTSIWKSREVRTSSRGLLSRPSSIRAASSTTSTISASAPI